MNNYNLTEDNSTLNSIQNILPKSQLANGVSKILLGSHFEEEKTNQLTSSLSAYPILKKLSPISVQFILRWTKLLAQY